MSHILTTIPKAKFDSWEICEHVLRKCDGATEWDGDNPWFWLINTANLPKKSGIGDVCFMIYDGQIRGYMDIVDIDVSENWRDSHDIGKPRNTYCIVMANWHPISPVPYTGFQGWRYTEIRP